MISAIFKAYDVRGTVPDQLNSDIARAIGAAFAVFSRSSKIAVARDMRVSGEQLSSAFMDGARSVGTGIIDLGLGSTDMLYFSTGELDIPGAMFTASHNPAVYNGIKMCLSGARPISSDNGLAEIADTAQGFLDNGIPSAARMGSYEQREMLTRFAEHVRSFIDLDKLKPLKVVVDTANGMGGLVVPAVFSELPFQLEILFPELDGNFPNHPADPIQPENLIDLKQHVVATAADVGLAFDGDADRVFLVDDQGQTISGSTTTSLVAKALLAKYPGSKILYNLICSKAVPEIISENGGIPIKTRVGHSFIKTVMGETDALFAGEHSGHYYFRDNFRADSGLIAAMVILEVLSTSDRPLSQLRTELERYSASGEVNTKVQDVNDVLAFIENAYEGRGKMDHMDGLTVDLGDWWFNVRPSNTEPLLRLNLEAKSDLEVASKVQEVLAVISKADSERK
ncbi:MAG: phosphomannomutase/phosphoglucomutase [Actinomycetota bacterium]|jgi:phosphomannomutase|nr:phosphomannomutase/phosphoglucomutase [Actinomycetota bacterium]